MELFGIDANNTVDVAITFYLTMAYLLLSVFLILKLEYKDLLLVLYYFILVVLVCCNLFPFFYVYNSFLFLGSMLPILSLYSNTWAAFGK